MHSKSAAYWRLAMVGAVLMAVVCGAWWGLTAGPWRGVDRLSSSLAASTSGPLQFVGSPACAQCHAAQNKAWQGSQHQLAMQVAKKAGHDLGYAFINESAPPIKVKHFLDAAKARNDAYGIRGVIVKRQGKNTSDQIIRMYTPNNL